MYMNVHQPPPPSENDRLGTESQNFNKFGKVEINTTPHAIIYSVNAFLYRFIWHLYNQCKTICISALKIIYNLFQTTEV